MGAEGGAVSKPSRGWDPSSPTSPAGRRPQASSWANPCCNFSRASGGPGHHLPMISPPPEPAPQPRLIHRRVGARTPPASPLQLETSPHPHPAATPSSPGPSAGPCCWPMLLAQCTSDHRSHILEHICVGGRGWGWGGSASVCSDSPLAPPQLRATPSPGPTMDPLKLKRASGPLPSLPPCFLRSLPSTLQKSKCRHKP